MNAEDPSDRDVAPSDDLPHPVGPEKNFSESLYFQFGDPASGLNGFVRLANRPNEGRGEQTACVFLPDGRVAFAFGRAAATDPSVFAAGGMRVEIDEPLVAQRVTFDGEASILDDPWAMTDPKAALAASPRQRCLIELTVRATAPAQAFSLDDRGDFTPHHFDQFVATRATVWVGDEMHTLDAYGLRDHGWGPRAWHGPSFYRWMFASCRDFGFAAGVLGRDGAVGTGGFVWDGGRISAIDDVTVETTYSEDAVASIALRITSGDHAWDVAGEVRNAIPLRHRRPDRTGFTRILETSVLWTTGGHRMLGIAEYLDQHVGGRLSGVDEYDAVGR